MIDLSYLQDAISGPGRFRFIIQPLIGVLLGVRDGMRDAKAGRQPYMYSLLTGTGKRADILGAGVRQILVPLCVGFAMDVLVRLLIGFGFHPVASVMVGALPVAIPYMLVRSVTGRAAKARRRGPNP